MATELEISFLAQVREHQGILGKICMLYADHEEDRADLRQEILLQAWRSYPRFRGEAKFSTWLYQVGLNTALTIRKKRRIRTSDLDSAPEPADPVIGNDDSQRLLVAMKRLPKAERMIVTLHLEGFKNQEIADMLGIKANHLNVKLHRTKQTLKNLLKPL